MNTVPLSMIRLVSPVAAATSAAFVGIGCAAALAKHPQERADKRGFGMLEVVAEAAEYGAPIASVIETLQELNVYPNGVPDYEIAEPTGAYIADHCDDIDGSADRRAVWAEVLRLSLALYADGSNAPEVVTRVVLLAAAHYHGTAPTGFPVGVVA